MITLDKNPRFAATADFEPEPVLSDDALVDDADAVIAMRPDGYYWVAPDGRQQFGPFRTRELACADRDLAAEEAPEPGETLQEAESELGITEWIDPETGEPAEGMSPPHLD